MAETHTINTPVDPSKPPTAPTDPNRPAWLPDNFKTPEDFAKSYGELQSKYTQLTQQAASPPQSKGDNADADGDDKQTKAIEKAGISLADLEAEYLEGDPGLSAETVAKIKEKTGFSDEDIKNYIDGRVAAANQKRSDVLSTIGGEDNFKKLSDWLATSGDKKDIETYNKAVDGGDADLTKAVLSGIYAKYVKAVGQAGEHVEGSQAGASQDVYESNEQALRDMRSDLYASDPAERKRVQDKLFRSKGILE